MYLIFEGVSDVERLLSVLLRITDRDITYAPHMLAVEVESEAEAEIITSNYKVDAMDDIPGGYWMYSVSNEEIYLDKVEESCIQFKRSHWSSKKRK